MSGAKTRVFPHNDMIELQKILQEVTESGTWDKIMIVVEGIYSMEVELSSFAMLMVLRVKWPISPKLSD